MSIGWLWTVYVSSIVMCLLYIYILRRVIKDTTSKLLMFLIVSMIAANIGASLWQYYNNLYFSNLCSAYSNKTTYTKSVLGLGFSSVATNAADTLAHWLFAY